MANPSSAPSDRDGDDAESEPSSPDGASGDADLEALRRQVEEKYDFDNFGPKDMAEMTMEEWEAVFDADSWVVGEELLDRVEKDLKNQIARRDVFAVVERITRDGEPQLVAYSDEGYAVVFPDGSIEGRGTVLRDVKPTVALCSMEEYEVQEPPANVSLPRPEDVPQGSGEFGNLMLQIVAGIQVLAGLGLVVAWAPPLRLITSIVAPFVGGVFLLIGLFLFATVANARLSDRFRAEEYRNRLRAVNFDEGERPDFLPLDDESVRSVSRDNRERDAEGP